MATTGPIKVDVMNLDSVKALAAELNEARPIVAAARAWEAARQSAMRAAEDGEKVFGLIAAYDNATGALAAALATTEENGG